MRASIHGPNIAVNEPPDNARGLIYNADQGTPRRRNGVSGSNSAPSRSPRRSAPPPRPSRGRPTHRQRPMWIDRPADTSCRTTPSRQATGQAAPGQVGGGCRSPPTRRDEGNPGTTPTTSAHELPQHPRGSTQTQPRTTTPTNSSTPTTGTHELPPYGTQTQPSITTPVKQLDTNNGAHEQPPHHPATPGRSPRPLHRLTAGPRRPVLTNYRRAPAWHPDTAVDRSAG